MANYFKILEIEPNDYNVVSVKNDDDVLDKGYICSISALATGQNDLYDVTEPTGVEGATPTEADLVIIDTSEPYINSFGQKTGGVTDPGDITYPAGTIVTAHRFPIGKRFKINQSAIDTTDSGEEIAVGTYLIPRDGEYDLATSATAPEGVGCVFIIENVSVKFAVGGSYVDALVARRVV